MDFMRTGESNFEIVVKMIVAIVVIIGVLYGCFNLYVYNIAKSMRESEMATATTETVETFDQNVLWGN